MSRLYGISYNDQQWCVKGSREDGYTLINKTTFDSYSIRGDVIGIEQITDDEFLVYRLISWDEWEPGNSYQIARILLKGREAVVTFEYTFYHHFHFLTEDIIIFDDAALLYSIKKNEKDDRLNHLFSENKSLHDRRLIRDRNIKFLYTNKEDLYPSCLLLEYRLNTHLFDTTEYLQVILDSSTLLPISPVYSTLRDKYFTLSSTLTLGQLVEEENRYMYIIGSFLHDLYSKDNRKSSDDMLNMITKMPD